MLNLSRFAVWSAFLLAGALCAQEKPAPPKVGGQYQATSQQPQVKTIER